MSWKDQKSLEKPLLKDVPDIPAFSVGQIVYHRACGTRGVVTAVAYGGSIYYQIAWGPDSCDNCGEYELSSEKIHDFPEPRSSEEV